MTMKTIIRTTPTQVCCDPEWEAAYQRFETPRQEIQKFLHRLNSFGAASWPKYAQIVEIFCGRGNGLQALHQLGFQRIEGVDLSEELLQKYDGDAQCYVADCRSLPFADNSRDVVIVQGGLHHLPVLPDDLKAVLKEVHRILRPGGRFCAVEPWRTPFLTFAHQVSDNRLMRRLWNKLDALAIMTEHEHRTYYQWLQAPDVILGLLNGYFEQQCCCRAWGKLRYEGIKRA
jgi:ubiquinone/menaquinone biosynthesis C-methylase UbiE